MPRASPHGRSRCRPVACEETASTLRQSRRARGPGRSKGQALSPATRLPPGTCSVRRGHDGDLAHRLRRLHTQDRTCEGHQGLRDQEPARLRSCRGSLASHARRDRRPPSRRRGHEVRARRDHQRPEPPAEAEALPGRGGRIPALPRPPGRRSTSRRPGARGTRATSMCGSTRRSPCGSAARSRHRALLQAGGAHQAEGPGHDRRDGRGARLTRGSGAQFGVLDVKNGKLLLPDGRWNAADTQIQIRGEARAFGEIWEAI